MENEGSAGGGVPTSDNLIGRKVRITLSSDSIVSSNLGQRYCDGTVVQMIPEHRLQGKTWHTPIAVILFTEGLKTTTDGAMPMYVIARPIHESPLIDVLRGYWVDVYLFGVEVILNDGRARESCDLDNRQEFLPVGEEMVYLSPKGRDPYLEIAYPHKFVSASRIEAQPYGTRQFRTCFDLLIERPDGTRMRAFTIQDDFEGMKTGSFVNLKYQVVDCTIAHVGDDKAGYLRNVDAMDPYLHELIGTVTSLWWPKAGVFTGGDLGGKDFTVQINDNLSVVVVDSLDARKSDAELRIGDTIQVKGRLMALIPAEERV